MRELVVEAGVDWAGVEGALMAEEEEKGLCVSVFQLYGGGRMCLDMTGRRQGRGVFCHNQRRNRRLPCGCLLACLRSSSPAAL